MKKLITLLAIAIIMIACASGRHHTKHKKLDPRKPIPCPRKDC